MRAREPRVASRSRTATRRSQSFPRSNLCSLYTMANRVCEYTSRLKHNRPRRADLFSRTGSVVRCGAAPPARPIRRDATDCTPRVLPLPRHRHGQADPPLPLSSARPQRSLSNQVVAAPNQPGRVFIGSGPGGRRVAARTLSLPEPNNGPCTDSLVTQALGDGSCRDRLWRNVVPRSLPRLETRSVPRL